MGHAVVALSLSFLILFPNNSTQLSQPACKMMPGHLMRSDFRGGSQKNGEEEAALRPWMKHEQHSTRTEILILMLLRVS